MKDQTSFKAAVIQMTSTIDVSDNMRLAIELIKEAAASGAEMIFTPEMTSLLGLKRQEIEPYLFTEENDPSVAAFSHLAQELEVVLNIGSIPLLKDKKIANRALTFDRDGKIIARYDKIHMFDVELADGQKFTESKAFIAGNQAVIADTPWGNLGLSICYDVRFPHLYRKLAKAGAKMLSVGAAFTETTGKAHWHVLLRARAIENGAFLFAPAQVGCHTKDRKSYGHSLIIDPWGNILADGGTKIGVTTAEIDLSLAYKARRAIPSLEHDKEINLR
jgi:predicted amidohydrolase